MGTTVGRLYFYAITLVSLLVATFAAGSLLATLGKLVFEAGPTLTGGTEFWRTTLSTYVPLLLVAGAIWAGHWSALRRRMQEKPEERQATLRKLFLNALLLVAAAAALFNATRLIYHALSFLTGATLPPIEGRARLQDVYNAAVWLLAYGAIWYYHWQVEAEEGQQTGAARTLRRWYVYLAALLALAALLSGVYYNLSLLVSKLVGTPAAQVVGDDLGQVLRIWSLTFAPIIAGAAVWLVHWRYAARSDRSSILRQVYLYLLVLLGMAGAVVALGIAEYQAVRFLFGYRDISPNAQLRFLTYAVPLLAVGGVGWLYHRRAAHEDAAGVGSRPLANVRRRYNYLVAGLGLTAVTVGLANLTRVLLEVLLQVGQEIGRTSDWWRDQLSGFLVTTVMGAAVWLPHWRSIEDIGVNSFEPLLRGAGRQTPGSARS